MKRTISITVLLCLLLCSGCFKHDDDNAWKNLSEDEQTLYFLNEFGFNMMSTYYLWNKEIKDGLDSWRYNVDPISKVYELRYKDEQGKAVDKWTVMTDDYEAFQGKVSGNTKSTGMDFALFYSDETKRHVVLVVTYTYPGSPAAQAGLKRGDKIVALNDNLLTPENYKLLLNSTLLGGGTTTLTMDDGKEISLAAKQMYLDPVNCHKVIEKDGRKIGYLHYTSFTLNSCEKLVEVFKEFKQAAITELVLDLRYNAGGYSLTSEVLASMIVPVKEIDNGSVFQRDIYNSILTEAWGEEKSIFQTDFDISDDSSSKHTVSTAGANPNISKLHVIMTGNSASASESTVCGLLPYMNIDIVGERSYGKFCGGFIVDGPTWYKWIKDDIDKDHYDSGVEHTANWGIYVMVSRYADKDGNTASMPDGIAPDIMVSDNPLDGYQLGDENETMLYVAINGKLPESGPAPASLGRGRPVMMESQLSRPALRIIPGKLL